MEETDHGRDGLQFEEEHFPLRAEVKREQENAINCKRTDQ
jgi:hypothetical protein